MNQKTVLHVGCGPYNAMALPALFRTDEWRELRLDINPDVQPDIVGSITAMEMVGDKSVDGLFSSHNLEHLYAHEVPIALAEFSRVLNDSGMALIVLPDIQAIARFVAKGGLEDTLYVSPAGPISPIDIFWGHREAIQAGNEFMAHRTGFTAQTLTQKLLGAGFPKVEVDSDGLNLWALACKASAEPYSLQREHRQASSGQEADGFFVRLRNLYRMLKRRPH